MEYFKSGLKSIVGAPQAGTQPSGAETVERLVDRVTSSTLLEDRRDACRALKALSRKYRVEVGAQGMNALRQILELDRTDCEIISYCLDTLCNITSNETFEEEQEHNPQLSNMNVGEQFTEMLIKNPENVSLALSFLEEYDFRVRWPAVKLLTSLVVAKPKEIQEIVLVSPMAVSKLMDLLGDSREVIRNDTLLLLIQLTKGNANIQKIVAFENAFDRLFDVIKEEGNTDGGIVVEDCLLLMLNLLKNNSSNQNFFKEGSYIQRLAPMFIIPPELEDQGWSPQKVSNIHCLLQLVRTMVTPGNPQQIVSSCQKTMRNCNLLEALCNILMASGVPADILTETINTVGEVIRGNLNNQEYFAGVMAPSNPPRPALVILLMSMVNEKQPFALRVAVLYCFECFLYKNEIGQSQVVQTLLPSTNSTAQSLSMGQLLCSGLFSTDTLSNWLSAIALSHSLVDNVAQKEQLLRVLLATNAGVQPVSLLQQITAALQTGGNTRLPAKLGMLALLATWLAHCPAAVRAFLALSGATAFLTAQASANEHDGNEELLQGMCAFLMGICVCFNDDSVPAFTIEALRQLIQRRVGVEAYSTALSAVTRHEAYATAAKAPQVRARTPSELLLDYEFCRLYKSLEGLIIKNVMHGIDSHSDQNGLTELSLSAQENGLLLQYKELIREQDRKLQELTMTINTLNSEKENLQTKLEELESQNSELRDQNTLLRAQIVVGTPPSSNNDEINITDQQIANLTERLKQAEMESTERSTELEKLRKDQEDLLELLTDQDTRLTQFKNRLRELGEDVDDGDSDINSVDAEGSEKDSS